MANNGFKVDLSSMVREIQDMNRAMEQLGQVAQGVFSNLGRAADMFGSKMNQQGIPGKSNSVILPGQDQMLTSRGAQAMSEAAERSGAAIRLQQQMALNPQGYMTNGEDQIMRRTQGANGTTYSYTGFDKGTLQQSILASQQSAQQSQNAQFGGFAPGIPRANDYKLAAGYNQRDLPRILGMSEDAAKLASNLGGMAGSSTNASVQNALNSVKGDLLRQNETFISNLTRYNSAEAGSDDQKKSFAELTRTMRDLENSVEDANNIAKDAKRFGGGGGGGSGGFKNFLAQHKEEFGTAIKSVLGITTAGVGGYLATDAALKRATYGKELERDESTASLASKSFQQLMNSHDMTKVENLLKYRGDMIFPDQFKYLGRGGFDNAFNTSGGITKDKLDLLQAERRQAMFGGISQIVGGIGTGVALGAMSGGLGLLSGVSGIAGGMNSLAQGYIGSQYTAASGGLEGGFGGFMANMMGSSPAARRHAREAAVAQMQNEQFSNAQMLQDLELQRNPNKLMGTQEYLDRTRAMNRSADLVGGYAMTANTGLSMSGRSRAMFDAASAQGQRNRALEGTIVPRTPLVLTAENRIAAIKDDMENNPDAFRQWSRQSGDLRKTISRSDLSVASQMEAARGEASRGGRDSYATSLGMSESEFMMTNAGLTNAMGSRASYAQTARLLSMSKGGLGSTEALMGSLTALNRVSGGADNTKQLEQIMAAGVSAGFDKSRVAMQFVQTTTELTRSLGLQSADSVARSLSFGASSISQTGRADERTLAMAAKGMGELANYTGSNSGTVGAMKLMGAYGAGSTLGQGAGILTNSSSAELIQYQRELGGSGALSDKAMNIVRLLGGDTPENRRRALSQVSGSLAGSTAGLRGTMEGSFAQNSALQKKYGVTSIAALMQVGKGFVGKQKDDFIHDMMAMGSESAAGNGMSSEMGQQFASQLLQTDAGFNSEADVNKLNKTIRAGVNKSVNPADVGMQRFIQQMYGQAKFDSAKTPIGMREYKDFLDAGGNATLSASYGGKQTTVTKDSLANAEILAAKGDKNAQGFLDDAKQEVSKMSRFDLAQQAQANSQAQEGAQKVYVTNMYQVSQYLKPMDMPKNFNRGN